MSEQLVKRLRELSNAVTRADWNEFSMRIPVEKDRDADFVLLQAADKISARGVSALCFPKPRAIDLKRAAWTIRASAVTCEKCLKILKERGPIQPDKKESGE